MCTSPTKRSRAVVCCRSTVSELTGAGAGSRASFRDPALVRRHAQSGGMPARLLLIRCW
jgi:hypothetical protein